jgi:hypothetical protein
MDDLLKAVIAIVIVALIIFVFTSMGDDKTPKTQSFTSNRSYEEQEENKPLEKVNSWMDIIKDNELDPSVEKNHDAFVRDVMRFSSGANFTSVSDDNTNSAFVNWVGLRRPSHVNIGASARQIPDIDETILQRNKPFRFN